MIQITFYKKADESLKGFQVLGHADSVEEGADLVCCAVSVLTINVLNSLEKFTDADYEVTEHEQMGLIQLTFRGDPGADAQLLVQSYALGGESVASQYFDWLQVIYREV